MFDYGLLNGSGNWFREAAELIQRSNRGMVDEAIYIGKKLMEAKAKIPHGMFTEWIKAEFGWSIRTAQNYMAVAERFGGDETVAFLGFSILLVLSADEVPDAAVEEVVALAASGEKVTKAKAEEVKKKHTTRKPRNRIATQIEQVYGPEPEAIQEVAVEAEPAVEVPEEVPADPAATMAEIHRLMTTLNFDQQQQVVAEYVEPKQTMLIAEMEPDSAALKYQVQHSDKLDAARVLFDSCDSTERKSVSNLFKALMQQGASGRYSEEFEEFWAAYPPRRRKDKGKAFIAWGKALKSLLKETPPAQDGSWERHLIRRASEYASSDVGRGDYVKGPEPWLNGSCWEDDPAAWGDGRKDPGLFVPGTESESGFF